MQEKRSCTADGNSELNSNFVCAAWAGRSGVVAARRAWGREEQRGKSQLRKCQSNTPPKTRGYGVTASRQQPPTVSLTIKLCFHARNMRARVSRARKAWGGRLTSSNARNEWRHNQCCGCRGQHVHAEALHDKRRALPVRLMRKRRREVHGEKRAVAGDGFNENAFVKVGGSTGKILWTSHFPWRFARTVTDPFHQRRKPRKAKTLIARV